MTPAARATLHTDRNAARAEADRLVARLTTAEADAKTQRRAACNLRDALDRVATAAGVADGSGDEVADRIVAAFDKLREERDQARSAARTPTKPEAQPVATVEPAPTLRYKPAPRYAPSPIDHLIEPRFAADRYVVVPCAAVEDIPPKRALWRSAAFNASMAANSLNRSKDARDHFGWGHIPAPEARRWAVVDRGEPIGEEG